MAAGRLQGQHDAMATSSISNLISSPLLHLALLSPEAGNFLIWKEPKMACGCHDNSNCTLPNGLGSHKGNLSANQRIFNPKELQRDLHPLTWPWKALGLGGESSCLLHGKLPACFEVIPRQAAQPGQPKVFRQDLGTENSLEDPLGRLF